MLNLYHAPDLETLGELATTLLAQPLADPFARARIVVPSQGMGRWLTLELARKQGIAMQLDLQLPGRLRLGPQPHGARQDLPEQSAFAPSTLTWRLYGWLSEPANLQLAPRLAQYLDGGDERRRLSLAAKIADTFDQYLLYRDDWLAAWERGETLDLGADESWQALLWRELTKNGHPHRARLLGDLLQRLYRDEPLAGLPERLLVFGIGGLPPHHLRVLDGLARHIDVVVCALNPSREAWGEFRDIRELARRPESAADDWYLDVGHPLLASLGKQGRDFFDALFALDGAEFGLYSEDADLRDDSLLHALQQDILRLRTRRPEERMALAADDRSLEVHVAHSPLREVEILHDQLLARFAADPALSPDQVVVLTPDIERYAPFIEAVFAAREGVPRIPYSLADRSLRAEVPLIEAFLQLLLLAQSRFTAEEVLAWLEQPAIARRAGIDNEDLPLLRDWLRDAGVRWGRDAGQRAALGLPDEAAHLAPGAGSPAAGFCRAAATGRRRRAAARRATGRWMPWKARAASCSGGWWHSSSASASWPTGSPARDRWRNGPTICSCCSTSCSMSARPAIPCCCCRRPARRCASRRRRRTWPGRSRWSWYINSSARRCSREAGRRAFSPAR
ncbi:RecBCD enzyme subunit RecC [Stutzerimonas stutzeri]